ncbi:MAG: hypothetical protein Aurels2KO_17780 [Aureliella sp.]
MTSEDKNSWQEWEVTAFVLGELDADASHRIEQAALADPKLAAEIEQVRETTNLVAKAMAPATAEQTVGLGEDSLAQILSHADASEDRAVVANSSLWTRRFAWGGATVAAGGLVAVLSLPEWRGQGETRVSQVTSKGETNRVASTVSSEGTPLYEVASAPATTTGAKQSSAPERSVLPLKTVLASPGDAKTAGGYGMSGGGYGGMGGGYGGGGYGGGTGGYGGAYAGGEGGGYGGEGNGVYGDATVASVELGQASPHGLGGDYGAPAPATGGYGVDGGYGGYGGGAPGASGQSAAGDHAAGGLGGGGGGMGRGEPAAAGDQRLSKQLAQPYSGLTPRIIIQDEEEDNFGVGRGVRRERTRTLSIGGGKYAQIVENEFTGAKEVPLSTFSIDVDTAAYSKCRQLLLENQTLPPVSAVRLEEFVNYFDYEYAGPEGDDPFAAHLAVASCPWAPTHKLVRIALQAEKVEVEQRPASNIVFLLDVSGSMSNVNKLPLVQESMRMLVRQLDENDRVAMVVYAGAAGCVLESTTGDQQAEILAALERLKAGGSTNGAQGIQLAYDIARDNFIPGGVNRVILCTDGDFNVGVTSTEALVDLVEENARSKVFLTVLGFGMGNTNDAMMEKISNNGNGVYGFVDNRREAHRQMVSQLAGNLITIAKDVKIQVEFNPTKVQSYRLLGYENRVMANEDFNDDTKDAGEIGAGHRVTAMYEIVPVGVESSLNRPKVDPLRYQVDAREEDKEPVDQTVVPPADFASELLAVKLRYKEPEGEVSKLLMFPLEDSNVEFADADRDFRWSASMIQFGMLLRRSSYKGASTWHQLVDQASSAAGISPDQDRQECLTMIRMARKLSGQ